MKRFSNLIVFVFLFASSFFVVPKELVHELTFHEDSKDISCDPGNGLAVSARHHHCEALQLCVPPVKRTDATLHVPDKGLQVAHTVFDSPAVSVAAIDKFSIRGPPFVS